QACRTGERLEVVAAGALGADEEEQQIDRRVVDRVEGQRLCEPREDAVDAPWPGAEAGMRDGDALAHRRRAQALARHQRIEDRLRREAAERGGARGKLGERLRLVRRA